jgi:hypothetical protein
MQAVGEGDSGLAEKLTGVSDEKHRRAGVVMMQPGKAALRIYPGGEGTGGAGNAIRGQSKCHQLSKMLRRSPET